MLLQLDGYSQVHALLSAGLETCEDTGILVQNCMVTLVPNPATETKRRRAQINEVLSCLGCQTFFCGCVGGDEVDCHSHGVQEFDVSQDLAYLKCVPYPAN